MPLSHILRKENIVIGVIYLWKITTIILYRRNYIDVKKSLFLYRIIPKFMVFYNSAIYMHLFISKVYRFSIRAIILGALDMIEPAIDAILEASRSFSLDSINRLSVANNSEAIREL